MTQERWCALGIKEQMSNIHGEIVRMIRARNNYISGKTGEDRSGDYLEKIHNLICLTYDDPKNIKRERELEDEETELRRWVNGEVDDRYILRYWEQYTKAIS